MDGDKIIGAHSVWWNSWLRTVYPLKGCYASHMPGKMALENFPLDLASKMDTMRMDVDSSPMGAMILNKTYFSLCLLVVLLTGHNGFAQDFTVYVGTVPPFTQLNEDGIVSGAAVDVVTTIMERAGIPVDPEKFRPISWARAVEDTETTPHTMLFCVARTPQREQRFKWVGPIASLNLGLVGAKSRRIVINAPDDIKMYQIGAIRNSAPVHIMKKQYGISDDHLTLLATDKLQFKMLEQGRVDLIAQADTAAPSWIKELGMDQSDFEMVYVLKHLKLFIAFNKTTDDAVIAKLQAELDAMKKPAANGVSEYGRIMKRYLEHGAIAMQQR